VLAAPTSPLDFRSAFRIVKAIMYSVDGRIKDTLLLGALVLAQRSASESSRISARAAQRAYRREHARGPISGKES